jgi:hypothetical protein
LAEAILPACLPVREHSFGMEILDLPADSSIEPAGIEERDWPDARPALD